MPTQQNFNKFPLFPEDVPVIALRCLSYEKLQKQDESESAALFGACRGMGFVLIDFQGNKDGEAFLEKALEMFQITEEINAMDADYLEKYVYQPPGSLFGYKKVGAIKIEDGRPDRVSFYNVGQDYMLGNSNPRDNASCIEANRASISAYMKQAHEVCALVCTHLQKQLHLPPNALSSLQPQNQVSGTALRMLRYAPQPSGDRQTSLLGHTDIGSMTLLFNVTGGLQVLKPGYDDPKDDASWAYIRPQPGCAILNLGDAMVEWTAGILRSNMHRVTWAPGEQGKAMRYSHAYLVRPAAEAPMKRLAGGDSLIPGIEDGEEENLMNAKEWEACKAKAIQAGRDNARSRGARNLVRKKPEAAAVSAVGA
ncbi:MAG: hypothetical protein Q9160_006171 [Pyrenula sp. 1 TL-2023]